MNHKGTKTLETERLFLRPFTQGDAEPMFYNWASDPEVTKYLTWPAHTNVEETKKIVTYWAGGNDDPRKYQWAIVPKESGEPVGSISAVRMDERTDSVTVGYCIGSHFWGRGITAEALRAVIAFFFEEVGANCVNACHDPRNPNSGRVMRKSGMTYEGTWRAGGVNNQGICDECWYSIIKDEYQKKKNPDTIWDRLYEAALAVQDGRRISSFIDAGGVAAALFTSAGHIYTGVCVDTCSALGICAERNAIFHMLTMGEHEIEKILAIMPDGRTGAPCGACREFMAQLMPEHYGEIEVMLDYEQKRIVTLGELTPEWWIQGERGC